MKTTTKIFILLAAMAAVFFVVMLSIRSLGTPPDIPKDDAYDAELNQYISNLKRYKTLDEADVSFWNNIRCAEIFYHEMKIDASLCDGFIDNAMKEYMRVFGEKWNLARFKSPWTEGDIKEVGRRVENIKEVRHTDRSSACGKVYQDDLDKLKEISDNYSSAKRLCKNFTFSNLESAKKDAGDINKYINDEYLRHCKTLADGLAKALEGLHSSHYQYVRKRVDDLTYFVSSGEYKSKTKSFFDNVYLELANQALKEYEDNAKSLYGNIYITSQYRINIADATKKVYDYYYAQNPGLASGLSNNQRGYERGHEYVDLGLSVKWATCNVGASSPSGYGNYYAWGETNVKYEYTSNTINSSARWRSTDIGGNSQYDVAKALWGGSWRMPTKAEIDDLAYKCSWIWTSQDGQKGYRITGPNGNSIFLPAPGYKNGKSFELRGVVGHYWCSTPTGESAYCYVVCENVKPCVSAYYKYMGFSVRPVIK